MSKVSKGQRGNCRSSISSVVMWIHLKFKVPFPNYILLAMMALLVKFYCDRFTGKVPFSNYLKWLYLKRNCELNFLFLWFWRGDPVSAIHLKSDGSKLLYLQSRNTLQACRRSLCCMYICCGVSLKHLLWHRRSHQLMSYILWQGQWLVSVDGNWPKQPSASQHLT